ncbi:uncharacterized protein METZ01_LOCUS72389 [marine metagenome]|uniref:Uncharacterized protein n=1 Tax=marine metagenome TaxID=408172 RepID=A0A381TU13_9ZZZZ
MPENIENLYWMLRKDLELVEGKIIIFPTCSTVFMTAGIVFSRECTARPIMYYL